MSAGSDILWTSLIPGLSHIEQQFAHKPEGAEGGHGEAPATHAQTGEAAKAPAHAGEPALHVSGSIFIILIIVALSVIARMGLKTDNLSDDDLIPDDKLSIKNIMEIIVSGIKGLMEGIMGHDWPKFVHLIGTFALFILFCNLSGLVPGFLPPTENVNVTFALGIIVFVATHYYGFKANGIGYIKHFMGPMPVLAPLMFPIEIISHLARPLSLGLRLFGNIMGDHKVGAIFFGLMAIGLPVVTLGLGVFVSFVQTFVFCLLSMIYLAGAVAHDH